jgi:dissimilatory sulfite reductase related protein
MNAAAQPLIETPDDASLLDEDGFLANTDDWNEVIARQIADDERVPVLTDRHWQVIHRIRNHYFRIGGVPSLRRVCRATELRKDDIEKLFGGCLATWRIAGLPNPGEEAKAYLL